MRTFCIVPAAGTGQRMGGKQPKQFLLLGDKPVVLHTLLALDRSDSIDEIYLVVGKKLASFLSFENLKKMGVSKLAGVILGGMKRQESVHNGVEALAGKAGDMVIVHDGVRPFVTEKTIAECLKEAKIRGAAVAALPPSDTLKEVREGKIVGDIDRNLCRRIQTPQCFKYEILLQAHREAKKKNCLFTDDSGLVRALGAAVGVVPGDEHNIKITNPFDLTIAESILKSP